MDALVDYLVPVGLDLGIRDILKVVVTAKSGDRECKRSFCDPEIKTRKTGETDPDMIVFVERCYSK